MIRTKPRTCKTCTIDVLYAMVRNEEALLPSHEHSSTVTVHCEMRHLQLVLDMAESGETSPMDHVLLLIGTPIPRQETIAASDDLGVEVGCQLRPVVGQSTNTKIAAQKR